ncbi:hypothetical protein OROHE_009480 [Orobanche hederae]
MNKDAWMWRGSKSGTYIVKEVYEILHNRRYQERILKEEVCKLIWKNDIPKKIQVHCWRALLNRLPTKANLQRRGAWEDGF